MVIKTILLTENTDFLSCLSKGEIDEFGVSTYTTNDFEEVINELKTNQYLLVSMSINKNNKDQVVRRIKLIRSITLIPITILAEEPLSLSYKLNVLDNGADQFFQLPMPNEEIMAQSLALIRRFSEFSKVVSPVSILYTHGMIINTNNRMIHIKGEEIFLQRKEFDILLLLIRNSGIVLKYERIFCQVWGEEYIDSSNDKLHRQIFKLREKIQIHDDMPNFIKTIHGIGYSFDPQYDT